MTHAQAVVINHPIKIPGWHIGRRGEFRSFISKVAHPGPKGAPKDPWGRSFEAGSLHAVEQQNRITEFRGSVQISNTTVEVVIINK